MERYKIIALVGKAGAGKDRILRETLACSDFHEIVSCTTRPPREGEFEGIHYHFYEEKDFVDQILLDNMLEHTVFRGWFYGTGIESVDANEINIGVFNPAGIESLEARDDVDLMVVWVRASDKERLLRQLNREGDPDCKEIVRRFQTDEEDFDRVKFDYYEIWNEGAGALRLATEKIKSWAESHFNRRAK